MPKTVGWNGFVDTRTQAEYERLSLLEQIFDPFSLRNLDRFEIRPGWRCLEVGAGAGSVARRMAELAGGEHVVATDLSLKFLGPLEELGITVLHHDITADPAPGEFDLIHARFVLDHLAEREAVLKRLTSWLRPGGWLLVEMATTLPELSSHPDVRRSMETLGLVLSQRVGTDPNFARTLPLPLEDAGLVACDSEGLIMPARGGSPLARFLRSTTRLVEAHAVENGMIGQDVLDSAFATYDDPSFVDYSWMTIAAWGQRSRDEQH